MQTDTENQTQTNTKRGVVIEIYPRMCRVAEEIENGAFESKNTFLCTYRRAQMVSRNAESRERSPVAPGDFVEFIPMGSRDGVVEKLLPRRNLLQRKAPAKSEAVLHTIATNIDQLAIVASCKEPDFSLGLVDRFLVAAFAEKIHPILIVTKIDLWPKDQEKPWDLYRNIGVDVFEIEMPPGANAEISPELVLGVGEVRKTLANKTTVFCGHSGVGKTTLLNLIDEKNIRVTGTVNRVTKKGKHTTTVSKMLFVGDARLIDTPGVREFSLSYIDPDQLIQCFPEIEKTPILEQSKMPRFDSYVRIRESIIEDKNDPYSKPSTVLRPQPQGHKQKNRSR